MSAGLLCSVCPGTFYLPAVRNPFASAHVIHKTTAHWTSLLLDVTCIREPQENNSSIIKYEQRTSITAVHRTATLGPRLSGGVELRQALYFQLTRNRPGEEWCKWSHKVLPSYVRHRNTVDCLMLLCLPEGITRVYSRVCWWCRAVIAWYHRENNKTHNFSFSATVFEVSRQRSQHGDKLAFRSLWSCSVKQKAFAYTHVRSQGKVNCNLLLQREFACPGVADVSVWNTETSKAGTWRSVLS